MSDSILNTLIEAAQHCRKCNHIRLCHKFIEKGGDVMHCIDASLNSRGKYKVCGCKDFEPKDNLEYLEWKHLKKRKK